MKGMKKVEVYLGGEKQEYLNDSVIPKEYEAFFNKERVVIAALLVVLACLISMIKVI